MHAKEHLQWLEEQGLLEKAKTYSEVFKKVLKDCLDVQKDERILIITDQGKENKRLAPIVSGAYYLAAREMGFDATMIVQAVKIKGDKADENTLVALQELGNGKIVVMCLSGKLGSIRELSKSFRNFIRESHHRFVSATSLGRLTEEDYQVFIDSIDIDYPELQEKGKKIKEKLDNAEEIRIVTDSGTDLAIGLGNKAVLNTGDYRNPGKGGNIPAGEVYLAPKWKSVEGTLVIDASSAYRKGTQLIEKPILLDISRGEIVNITGGKEADNLRNTLEWACNKAKYPWGIKRVGELGIGINPNAKVIGATMVDEKVKGTAHIGIGSNYWFGGTIYAIIHFDQVFNKPKIYIDGELLEI